MGSIRKKLFAICMVIICTLALIMPDIAWASEVKEGNTIGNLNNMGDIVQDNDWIYMNKVTTPRNIILKVKKDGSEVQQISIPDNHSAYYLNLVDDWIYYTHISSKMWKTYMCKRKTSGGKEIKLCSGYSFGSPGGGGGLYVYDNWIYFIQDKGIYRMKTDGTKKAVVARAGADEYIMGFCIDGQWLYYTDDGLHKVRLNGTSKKSLNKKVFGTCVASGSWIFSDGDDDGVYRTRKDGSKTQKILSNVKEWNISNGWIYYTSSKGLYKIKTDGTSKKRLVKAGTVLNARAMNYINSISVLDNRIYFYYMIKREMGEPVYRASINTDGTNLRTGWMPEWKGSFEGEFISLVREKAD